MSKSNSAGSTSYRYDGQLGIEDIDFGPSGIAVKVTDYGLGGRGIDAMYVTQSGSVTASYPIYDAHGNMLTFLSRQGANGFTYTALRTYDAWGVVRKGAKTGDPKGRYCANIGHKQDDESGLTYMRARYYDSSSGRFLGEDIQRQGWNPVVYCGNNPVDFSDSTGQYRWKNDWTGSAGRFTFDAAMSFVIWAAICVASKNPAGAIAAIAFAATLAAASLSGTDMGSPKFALGMFRVLASSAFRNILLSIVSGLSAATQSFLAFGAIVADTAYTVMVLGALISCEEDDDD